jgi:hypothetical protein
VFVCCVCCILSGRGLCDELFSRPEESYRLWRVVICKHETSCDEEAIIIINNIIYNYTMYTLIAKCTLYKYSKELRKRFKLFHVAALKTKKLLYNSVSLLLPSKHFS